MIILKMVKLKFYAGTGKKKYKVQIFEKGKKLKTVQFGAKGYSQYRDSTPLKLYYKLDHNDTKRKANYFKRHKINYPKYSSDYFSKKYLWDKK